MTSKRQELFDFSKSDKSEDKEKTFKFGIKLGIPEGQMNRIIRKIKAGTWKPAERGNGKAPKKAKKAKAKKAAPKKKAAKKKAAKKSAPRKAKTTTTQAPASPPA